MILQSRFQLELQSSEYLLLKGPLPKYLTHTHGKLVLVGGRETLCPHQVGLSIKYLHHVAANSFQNIYSKSELL